MKEQIIVFATNNINLIVILLALLVFSLTSPKLAKAAAKAKAKEYMVLAEKRAKDYLLKDGFSKFKWVADKAYNVLPFYVRFWITQSLFDTLVQEAYNEIMDIIDDGKNNDSYSG